MSEWVMTVDHSISYTGAVCVSPKPNTDVWLVLCEVNSFIEGITFIYGVLLLGNVNNTNEIEGERNASTF